MILLSGHIISAAHIVHVEARISDAGQAIGSRVWIHGGGYVELPDPTEAVHAAIVAATPERPRTVLDQLAEGAALVLAALGWTPPAR